MKKIIISGLCAITIGFFSCTKDLDTEPVVERSLSRLLEENPQAIQSIIAKLYAGLSVHGQGIPGSTDQIPDILGDDPGETVYLRALWNMQEMTSDIVKNGWGDGGLAPLTTTQGWTATNKFFGYIYNRIFFQISQVNNLILELDKVTVPNEAVYIAEARFLRALSYYHVMDLFGAVPIITENEGIGSGAQAPATRSAIFAYVESELKELENLIPEDLGYGRANKASVQMILAKIYLNAEVYTGTERYADALKYSKKVIDNSNFSLDENYQSIFQADNFRSKEIIFPLIADKANTQSFGNATYLINGSSSTDTMPIEEFGSQNGWTGHRCTKAIYGLFGSLDTTNDSRAIFWTEGHEFEMNSIGKWTDGYPTTKFRNTRADGVRNLTNFTDTDFPLFRLADAYLMYAEAHLKSMQGDPGLAVDYVNRLQERAFGNSSNNITINDLTLDFVIDERARELYYEGHRRQDLIRFNRFTGGAYLWPWKGGTVEGTSIPAHYNLFPKPLEALQANPKLQQNPGY